MFLYVTIHTQPTDSQMVLYCIALIMMTIRLTRTSAIFANCGGYQPPGLHCSVHFHLNCGPVVDVIAMSLLPLSPLYTRLLGVCRAPFARLTCDDFTIPQVIIVTLLGSVHAVLLFVLFITALAERLPAIFFAAAARKKLRGCGQCDVTTPTFFGRVLNSHDEAPFFVGGQGRLNASDVRRPVSQYSTQLQLVSKVAGGTR